MIDQKEIEEKSKELQIHTSNIQRDYVFGWFLHYIFSRSAFKETLFLKGGNALRKGYFLETRFSSDLDFGTPRDIDQSLLIQEILKACDYIESQTHIEFVRDRNSVQEKFNIWKEQRWQVYEAKIYFKDFYGNSDHIILKISLDVTRFDKNYLPIQSVKLLHPYSDKDKVETEIRCMQLEEVLATKLKCMLQREHAPDMFDLLYGLVLNNQVNIDRGQLRTVFLKRTIFERNPTVVKNILLKLPLEFIRAKWAKSIVYTNSKLLKVEEAIDIFFDQITQLFADYPDQGYGDRRFFEAEVRNKILKAGRNFTLLKIVYKGYERLVEPYSLKFMQRLDGVAREYLYVYDLVGSKSNPGVKMFVSENIQLIENTEDTFVPRQGYEVGLNRAGEYPEDRYLYGKSRENKALNWPYSLKTEKETREKRKRKVVKVLSGPKYKYKCSTCGKHFYRKSSTTSLRTHKNKRGFSCQGYPIYLGMKY